MAEQFSVEFGNPDKAPSLDRLSYLFAVKSIVEPPKLKPLLREAIVRSSELDPSQLTLAAEELLTSIDYATIAGLINDEKPTPELRQARHLLMVGRDSLRMATTRPPEAFEVLEDACEHIGHHYDGVRDDGEREVMIKDSLGRLADGVLDFSGVSLRGKHSLQRQIKTKLHKKDLREPIHSHEEDHAHTLRKHFRRVIFTYALHAATVEPVDPFLDIFVLKGLNQSSDFGKKHARMVKFPD